MSKKEMKSGTAAKEDMVKSAPKPNVASGNKKALAEASDEKEDFKKGGAPKKKAHMMDGGKAAPRLDKPCRASGGATKSPFSNAHKVSSAS